MMYYSSSLPGKTKLDESNDSLLTCRETCKSMFHPIILTIAHILIGLIIVLVAALRIRNNGSYRFITLRCSLKYNWYLLQLTAFFAQLKTYGNSRLFVRFLGLVYLVRAAGETEPDSLTYFTIGYYSN